VSLLPKVLSTNIQSNWAKGGMGLSNHPTGGVTNQALLTPPSEVMYRTSQFIFYLFRLKTKGPGGHLHCSRLHIKYNKIYSSMQQYIVHKTTTECNMHEAISTLF